MLHIYYPVLFAVHAQRFTLDKENVYPGDTLEISWSGDTGRAGLYLSIYLDVSFSDPQLKAKQWLTSLNGSGKYVWTVSH